MPYLSSLSLALNRPGAVGGAAPLTLEQQVAALFSGGEQGAWYDPSDFSTMFETAAGEAPISVVEKPVGLILDKRKGLALGAELNDGLGDAANWTALGTNTIGESGDEIAVTYVDNAGGATAALSAAAGLSSNLTVGKWYKVTGEVKVNTGSVNVAVSAATTFATAAITSTSFVAFTLYFLASNATTNTLTFTNLSSGEIVTVRSLSVKLLDGNHAYQTGSTARPVLRARYNLLTYSEQFDNAAWTPTASTISANTGDTTDPIGTNTAEKYTNTAASDNVTRTAAITVVAGVNYTLSVYAKKGTQDWLRLSGWADSLGTTIGFNAWFDLANGVVGSTASGAGGTVVSSSIQDAGNGWYRCIVVGRLTSATTFYPVLCMTTADNVATRPATSNVVYLWGADLRVGTSAGTYQRIAAATDYATGAAFPVYLDFDGADGLTTASADFTASDEILVSCSVFKSRTGSQEVLAELDASSLTAGTFALFAEISSGQARFRSTGASAADAEAAVTSPSYHILTGIGDISLDTCLLRRNASQIATSGTDQGVRSAYKSAPINIGARNNIASTWLSGRIYGLILRGGNSTASATASIENYLASKMGVTL